MNIHEYQAKQLFQNYGIPVPQGMHVNTSERAKEIAEKLGGEGWVVKAQVHAGGRGKVGGVKVAKNITEVVEISESLLGKRLVTIQTDSAGLPINSLLIEKLYPIKRELYVSILVDRASERVIFIASVAGGVDIAAMATQPKGYEVYNSLTIKDAGFYAPKDIYGNQTNVDNARALRQLGSDRLHQEMVDQQFRR